MRSTKTSKRVQSYANKAIKSSRKALLEVACEDMQKEFVRNKHKLPYGHMTNLVNELRQREDWVTKNIVNKAFIKYRKESAIRELRESLVTLPSVPNTIKKIMRLKCCEKNKIRNQSTDVPCITYVCCCICIFFTPKCRIMRTQQKDPLFKLTLWCRLWGLEIVVSCDVFFELRKERLQKQTLK